MRAPKARAILGGSGDFLHFADKILQKKILLLRITHSYYPFSISPRISFFYRGGPLALWGGGGGGLSPFASALVDTTDCFILFYIKRMGEMIALEIVSNLYDKTVVILFNLQVGFPLFKTKISS